MVDTIAEFVSTSEALVGQSIEERKPWNQCASADAIRHFAFGTSDANPLWIDGNYARETVHGGLIAPPLFVASVRYPVLHGAATSLASENWISRLRFRWFQRVRVDASLLGTSRLTSAALLGQHEDRVQRCTRTDYRDDGGTTIARRRGSRSDFSERR